MAFLTPREQGAFLDPHSAKHRDVQLFSTSLLSRYGNYVRGWRLLLDRDGSGRVSRGEFLAACRRLRFAGDAEVVFQHLAGADGELELDELDPEAAGLLNEFALFIRFRFGTVQNAFTSGLTHNAKEGGVDFQAFMHACLEMRFRSQNFRKLFECLDFDKGGTVSLDELQFLEHWKAEVFVPPAPDEILLKLLQNRAPLSKIIALVHAEGANVNLCSPGADPALLQAAERGTERDLADLLQMGADPRQANVYGLTALHRAADRPPGRVDCTRVIQLLVSAGAEINAMTPTKTTPLHSASAAGRPLAVAMLCHLGADANAHDAQNRSPLFFSVFKGHVECAKHLLAAHADPCRNDCNDHSCMELAIMYRQYDIIDLLKKQARTLLPQLLPEALGLLCRDFVEAREVKDQDEAVEEAEETVASYLDHAGVDYAKVADVVEKWRLAVPEHAMDGAYRISQACKKLCLDRGEASSRSSRSRRPGDMMKSSARSSSADARAPQVARPSSAGPGGRPGSAGPGRRPGSAGPAGRNPRAPPKGLAGSSSARLMSAGPTRRANGLPVPCGQAAARAEARANRSLTAYPKYTPVLQGF